VNAPDVGTAVGAAGESAAAGAQDVAAPPPKRSLRGRVVRYLAFFAAVLATKLFVVDVYGVREQSMWPYLRGGRDRVVVDKTAGWRGAIERFDVVVARRDGLAFVKRVLSTGGERLLFRGGDALRYEGDAQGAEGENPWKRIVRDPETVAAMAVEIYPGEAGGPARFRIAADAALEAVDGATLRLRPAGSGPDAVGRATLLGSAASTDGVLRDDHPDADGRTVRGRNAVADVDVEIGALRLAPGASFAVVHRLRDETRRVRVAPDGVWIEIEEKDRAARLVPFPGVPTPAGLRVRTLDGEFSVLNLRDGVWRELFREPRETGRFGGWSTLTFEASGGAVDLGALAVRRDAHYVGPDGRDDDFERSVPLGEFFLVGDNVPASTDSRTFGTVRRSELVGRVVNVRRP
jgi:signal peptidase I